MTQTSTEVALPLATFRRLLCWSVGFVIYAGLCAEVWQYALGLGDPYDLVSFFSLSDEQNLPTWLVSGLLLGCAGLLALVATSARQAGGRYVAHWWILAGAFLYISLDEFVQLHEHMNHWFDWGGFLYFGWVVPAGILVTLFGLAYLRFLAHLPPHTRHRFVLAGALYVGGALGVELALGYWTDLAGDQNFVYALVDWVEESMELIGVALFAWFLIEYLAGSAGRVAFVVQGSPTPGEAPAVASAPPSRARDRAARLLAVWALAAALGGALYVTGRTTYHRYEDRHGHPLFREQYLGEDLSSELRGGQRFVHVGTEASFDRGPEVRGLLLFALGAAAIILSARGGIPPPTRGRPDASGSGRA